MLDKRIKILGNGWFGNMLASYLNAEISDVQLREVNPFLLGQYDTVINTAAKTNIDWCERNKFETLAINSVDAADVASYCAEAQVQHVFISSACIFESVDQKDWKDEYSRPNPGCFYSLSKWMAEELIMEANPQSLIIRIRLPISEKPNPRNTITKILGYSKLQTNQESVSVLEDVLPVMRDLIQERATGVYHLVNEGTISPVEIADAMGKTDFEAVPKYVMDTEMMLANRARRVSTLIRSTRIKYLPNIRERMPQIAAVYKSL